MIRGSVNRDFLFNAWAKIHFLLQIRNQHIIPRRMMYIIISFMLKLLIFPIFCVSSRLRKNEIPYESYGKKVRNVFLPRHLRENRV